MTNIVLDAATAEKLRAADQRTELRDANGSVLGYVLPAADRSQSKTPDCPFTEEEIEELRQQRGGRSLEEIMKDLRKIA